jgi:HSP20 family protein
MNTVGIGKLKHAKPVLKAGSIPVSQQKARISKVRRPQEAPQEGQLAVEIIQTESMMIIICPIAGVEKGEIRVSIQDDVLTIRGERKRITGIPEKQALVRELFWGTFSRSIVLPDYIDRKNIEARVHEHMLIVQIPKTEDFKTRIIHINDSE